MILLYYYTGFLFNFYFLSIFYRDRGIPPDPHLLLLFMPLFGGNPHLLWIYRAIAFNAMFVLTARCIIVFYILHHRVYFIHGHSTTSLYCEIYWHSYHAFLLIIPVNQFILLTRIIFLFQYTILPKTHVFFSVFIIH